MSYSIDEQLAYFAANPPGLLAPWTHRAIPLPSHTFDGHGSPVNSIFELSCRCGGKTFTVHGYWSEENEMFESPISLECSTCELMDELYDLRSHGYNAVVTPLEIPLPEPETFDEITTDAMQILVRFEHGEDERDESRDDVSASDLFSWITIVTRDPKTQALVTVFDDETA